MSEVETLQLHAPGGGTGGGGVTVVDNFNGTAITLTLGGTTP